MAVKFNSTTKHSGLVLLPGVSLAFDDDRAEEFFVAAGWAETTDEAPVHVYPVGSVEIAPETVFADGANRGARVLGE